MQFWIYLLVTAGVTYLVRMLPLVLVKGKIRNRFVLSFLHYIPYAVLSVMTIPAIFYATQEPASAAGQVAAAIRGQDRQLGERPSSLPGTRRLWGPFPGEASWAPGAPGHLGYLTRGSLESDPACAREAAAKSQ